MTIDSELLMAYADGELDAVSAKRVERAVAADPELARQLARHRALADTLRAAFGPVADAPVPPAVHTLVEDAAKVVPLPARPARRERPLWMGAVAASLVAGLLAGPLLFSPRTGSDLAIEDGRPVARGEIARALDTQLAATQPGDAPVRIGVTFRDGGNRLCRTFERGATGGIACAQDRGWQVERLYGGLTQQGAAYRQAGSPAAAMMADAQAMMAGDPLDARAEAQVLAARR